MTSRPAFSNRSGAAATGPNPLSRQLEERRRAGLEVLDLTETNPTRCGLSPSAEVLREALSLEGIDRYEPDPRGLRATREAVAAHYRAVHRAEVSAEALVLTASTSEAYAYLFKLLCDGGDSVLVPHPAYPLFEHLAGLEEVRLRPYALPVEDGFALHRDAIVEAADARTRAVLVVSPANPIGRRLRELELSWLAPLCAERGWALIVDEVFADYVSPGDPHDPPVETIAGRALPCLTFALSGMSKGIALPQLKLGWIAASGPERWVGEALERLDLISDSYLSVSTAAQLAAPSLLARASELQWPLRERLAANRVALRDLRPLDAPWDLLETEGGWAQVLRLPAFPGEEETCQRLLAEGVLVHPGYFYDFPRGQYLVVSLLPEPAVFRAAVERLVRVLA